MNFVRTEVSNRPLLLALWGAIAAILVVIHPLYLIVLAVPLLITKGIRARIWLAVGFAILSLLIPAGFHVTQPLPKFPFQAMVVSPPVQGANAEIFTVSGGSKRYQVVWLHGDSVSIGDQIEISQAAAESPDQESANLTQLIIEPKRARKIGHGAGWITAALHWHEMLVSFANQHLGSYAAMTVDGLLLEDSSQLSPAFKKALTQTGVIFLVTISGIHIFIYAIIWAWLIPRELMPRALNLAIFAILLLVVAACSGFHAATVRAIIAVMGLEIAYLHRREPDGLSLLSFAGLIYLIWRPEACLEPGFQLSMLAVGLILCAGTGHGLRDEAKLLRIGFLGWLGSTPIGAYWFGIVSWTGMITGTIFSICLLPLMILFGLAYAFNAVPGLGATFLTALDQFGTLIYDSTMNFSDAVTGCSAYLPSAWLVLAAYAAIFLALWRRRLMEAPKRT